MPPLTLLAAQKVAGVLTARGALGQQIAQLAAEANIVIPTIEAGQVLLSSAPPDLADKNMQFAYPRICIYSGSVKNTQTEKFRSFSGTVAVSSDIWASGDFVTQTDEWIHYYLEAVTTMLRTNTGNWGDGIFFSGRYEVKLQPAKVGGLGFVEAATVTCTLDVSIS
jgi:hypothetical protein